MGLIIARPPAPAKVGSQVFTVHLAAHCGPNVTNLGGLPSRRPLFIAGSTVIGRSGCNHGQSALWTIVTPSDL